MGKDWTVTYFDVQVLSSPDDGSDHPLEYSYSLSYFKRPPGQFNPEEYSDHVQVIATFTTVNSNSLRKSIFPWYKGFCYRWSSFGAFIPIFADHQMWWIKWTSIYSKPGSSPSGRWVEGSKLKSKSGYWNEMKWYSGWGEQEWREMDNSIEEGFGVSHLGEFDSRDAWRTVHGWWRNLRCCLFHSKSG